MLFLLFKYGVKNFPGPVTEPGLSYRGLKLLTLQCERIIYGYMAFAAFNIFFIIAGLVGLQLIQLQAVPIDAVSFLFVLWNFSVRSYHSQRRRISLPATE